MTRVMEPVATVVVIGGLKQDAERGKRVYGTARAETGKASILMQQIEDVTDMLFGDSPDPIPRNQNIFLAFGFFEPYKANLVDLTFDINTGPGKGGRELIGDMYVPVWSRDPDRRAEVFSRIMDAVEARFD